MEIALKRSINSNEYESLEFNGIEYRRYINSTSKTARRYFFPYINGNRAKGWALLHRAIWEFHNGKIPENFIVHHKDKNVLNNDLTNLECISKKEHGERHKEEFKEERRIHAENIRPLAALWHGSKDGLLWHKKHGKDSWEEREKDVLCKCAECGFEFTSFLDKKDSKRFCSRQCNHKYHERNKTYYKDNVCIICGIIFKQRPRINRKQETCSRKCSGIKRRKNKTDSL